MSAPHWNNTPNRQQCWQQYYVSQHVVALHMTVVRFANHDPCAVACCCNPDSPLRSTKRVDNQSVTRMLYGVSSPAFVDDGTRGGLLVPCLSHSCSRSALAERSLACTTLLADMRLLHRPWVWPRAGAMAEATGELLDKGSRRDALSIVSRAQRPDCRVRAASFIYTQEACTPLSASFSNTFSAGS